MPTQTFSVISVQKATTPLNAIHYLSKRSLEQQLFYKHTHSMLSKVKLKLWGSLLRATAQRGSLEEQQQRDSFIKLEAIGNASNDTHRVLKKRKTAIQYEAIG